jgi:hypothetical protein
MFEKRELRPSTADLTIALFFLSAERSMGWLAGGGATAVRTTAAALFSTGAKDTVLDGVVLFAVLPLVLPPPM